MFCVHSKYFEQPATLFALTTINTKTTMALYHPPSGQTSIYSQVGCYGVAPQPVKSFPHLMGTTAGSDITIDVEINNLWSLWRTLRMITTWHYSMNEEQDVQDNCAYNTTVLSRDVCSLPSPCHMCFSCASLGSTTNLPKVMERPQFKRLNLETG